MPEALDLLRQDHGHMAALMRTLERQVNEFQSDQRPDFDVIIAILDYFLSFPDVCHHPREDLIFAKLSERDPRAIERIGDLRSEHDELAARARELLMGLRAVLEEVEVRREACYRRARRFIDRQRQHIDMEESTFFPAAEKTLTPADWKELNALMAKTDAARERFEQSRKRILQWQAEDEAAAVSGPNSHPAGRVA
jgi:hemerythrin-like domain-containing protein